MCWIKDVESSCCFAISRCILADHHLQKAQLASQVTPQFGPASSLAILLPVNCVCFLVAVFLPGIESAQHRSDESSFDVRELVDYYAGDLLPAQRRKIVAFGAIYLKSVPFYDARDFAAGCGRIIGVADLAGNMM